MSPERATLALVLLVIGCGEGGSGSGPTGRVLQAGAPVPGVLVTVEGFPAAISDANGEFRLDGVPQTFAAKARREHAGGRFEETLQNVSASEATLTLPAPLTLQLMPTSRTIELLWTASDSPAFLEYRVYVSADPGLDETTGFLAFSTRDRATTTFSMLAVMGVPDYETMLYFRVYAVDEGGATSGSNVRGALNTVWDQNHFDFVYDVNVQHAWAGTERLVSLAWDGEAAWLLYWRVLGAGEADGTLPDEITLARVDIDTRVVLRELTLPLQGQPRGLAWDGSQLWLGTSDDFVPASVVRVDPVSGETTGRLELPGVEGWDSGFGASALGWDGTHLVITRRVSSPEVPGVGSAVLQTLDPLTGEPLSQFELPPALLDPSGVACREGRYWIAGGGGPMDGWATLTPSGKLGIFDASGQQVGIAQTSLLPGPLDFAGDRLLLVSDNRVHTTTLSLHDESQ
jgi:hypothetical protein